MEDFFMKLFCVRVVLISLLVLVSPANLIAEVLTEDTTWSGNVIRDSNVVVPAGIVLTIEPGTTVSMNKGVTINVYGQLLADGNEAQPIRFKSTNSGVIRWRQIMFIKAADSRLVNCIIEDANSSGEHQEYYVWKPKRQHYHEAVTVLASHVDFEGCLFRNLYGPGTTSTSKEGDAIAIISDDPCYPGNASANITHCQFWDIGQGVHTRYAYVLVEHCYFVHKNGDNDDVDLWGESTPPCLIRYNLFDEPEHDDRINPTRCSAIIIGNVIRKSDDHGIVLRDKCSPIVMNNVIANCSSGGIAVENSCTALLVNNTIINCPKGIKCFDLGRWNPPYSLNPGGGTATVINCTIWDCSPSIYLEDSSNTKIPDRGSHVTVRYCDVKGGTASITISGTYSTYTWGEGNINLDPLFANATDPNLRKRDYHLKSLAGRWNPTTQMWVKDLVNSSCIDTGDPNDPNYSDWTAELWPNGRRINMGAYGGTTEASMSLLTVGNIGDLNNDDTVDFLDFANFAASWETHLPLFTVLALGPPPLREDLDRNKIVDCNDLSIFVDNWLWQK
jgi:hypothetical protein